MTEVKKTNWNQLIRAFPYTFSKETLQNTPLAGHEVTICSRDDRYYHNNNGYSMYWDILTLYGYHVSISKDGKSVDSFDTDTLDHCIQYIRRKCVYYEKKIKLERNMLFDTPIEP
jgi:hypothetical protein